jgi:hypothetical protein
VAVALHEEDDRLGLHEAAQVGALGGGERHYSRSIAPPREGSRARRWHPRNDGRRRNQRKKPRSAEDYEISPLVPDPQVRRSSCGRRVDMTRPRRQ